MDMCRSSLAQNSQHFRQSADFGVQPDDLQKLVAALTDHLQEPGLDDRQRKRA